MPNLERNQQIQHLKAELDKLLAEEQRERAKEIAEYVAEIRDVCADAGYDVVEIAKQLMPALDVPVSAPAKRKRSNPVLTVWRNPDNPSQTYKGRGMPSWMITAMREAGYDPDDKEQRRKYRDEVLVVDEAA